MKTAPLAQVKERFGSKEDLVKAVRELATDDLWVDRASKDGGLDLVSNRKLLHLYDVLSEIKSEFGSRAKLIDAIVELVKRQSDEGYRDRLERMSTPKLWDSYQAAKKRSKKAAA